MKLKLTEVIQTHEENLRITILRYKNVNEDKDEDKED